MLVDAFTRIELLRIPIHKTTTGLKKEKKELALFLMHEQDLTFLKPRYKFSLTGQKKGTEITFEILCGEGNMNTKHFATNYAKII